MNRPIINKVNHLAKLASIGIAALEDIANGEAMREKEYVWYGELTNPEQLQKATKVEVQRQSVVKSEKGTVRVRQTMCDGSISYTLTAKNYSAMGDAMEVSMPVTKDFFTVFRNMTGESMDKIRYTFPIEGTDLKWEVDVFITIDGTPKSWVKVDLEVPGVLNEWPPLPVLLGKMIFAGNNGYTPEQKTQLDQLFADVFNNKL